MTTKSGSPLRKRSSAEPGASSRVISSAAADSASSKVRRIAESPPFSPAAAKPAAKAFDVRGQVHGTSMASLWHFSSTKVTPNWRSAEERGAAPPRGTRHEHAYAAEQHDGRGGADSGVVPLEAGG